MSFLPKGYEVPNGASKYTKLEQGENRLRIMSSPILGTIAWEQTEEGRRPVRVRMGVPVTTGKSVDPESVRHFWAMKVFNYKDKAIQVWEVTQKSIQKTLKSLAKDEDWGSPVDKYDIVIVRTGEGMETRYEVLPKPAKETSQEVLEAFRETPINLEALYDGADPFAVEEVDPDDIPDDKE